VKCGTSYQEKPQGTDNPDQKEEQPNNAYPPANQEKRNKKAAWKKNTKPALCFSLLFCIR
jgi:hypothetical protein